MKPENVRQSTAEADLRDSYRKHDPELIILVLCTIAALGGLAGITQLHYRVQDRKLSVSRQTALRKRAKRALARTWSNLHELRELFLATKNFFKTTDIDPKKVSFKIGEGLVEVSEAELKRFLSYTDRMQRVQRNITKACADLRDAISGLKAVSKDEADGIEKLRSRIVSLLAEFNDKVFSQEYRDPKGESGKFKDYSEVLDAIEHLIEECADALRDFELILGKDYEG